MSDIMERLEGTKHGLYWDVARDSIAEITRLRTLLSEAEQREKEARRVAIEDCAKVAILTANHLTILPPSVRKFPEVGGIIAAKILAIEPSIELVKPVNNQPVENGESGDR